MENSNSKKYKNRKSAKKQGSICFSDVSAYGERVKLSKIAKSKKLELEDFVKGEILSLQENHLDSKDLQKK